VATGEEMKPNASILGTLPWTKYVGFVLAIGGLIWVLHGVHPARMFASIRAVDWWWVPPAVVFDVLSYYCQGVRWRLLLTPCGRISSLSATEAIYVGLFANEVIPLRIGEGVRLLVVSRLLNAGWKQIVPSIAIERLFDGFWMVIAIGITAIFVPLPSALARAAMVLGIVIVAGAGVLLWIITREERFSVRRPSSAVGEMITVFLSDLAAGFQRIGLTAPFYGSLGVSLLIILCAVLAFWLLIIAYGIPVSLWTAVAVFMIVRLGTAIPNAPSNVGSFQFFCVLGLTLFGVNKSVAAGFSFLVFGVLTIPLWILGTLALSRTGLTLSAIRRQLRANNKDRTGWHR
jgi:uncharacterized protein (TIRG00374 family)